MGLTPAGSAGVATGGSGFDWNALPAVPGGMVATIVTGLEMRERPKLRPLPPLPPGAPALRLARWHGPTNDAYRSLFRRVGAPWLWFSRLAMADDALSAIITHPDDHVFALCDARGVELGLLELDFRVAGTCELAFFGLVPELTGKGIGGWMMAQALGMAWRPGVKRVWVHTCTLDHPGALGFYQAHGFAPFARSVEVFPDPRLAGILPLDAAPHIPVIAA